VLLMYDKIEITYCIDRLFWNILALPAGSHDVKENVFSEVRTNKVYEQSERSTFYDA
jgi:hypothetical protein